MQSNFFYLSIIVGVIFILFFAKFIKFLFRLFFRIAISTLVIYFVNIFLSECLNLPKLRLGINFITCIMSGILGVPGIIVSYVVNKIL
jgi:hypothetical protein